MITRRDWLRMAAAGVSFCSASGWIESLAADDAEAPAAQALLHPALDAGRTEPARYVRSQAGTRQRRPVQGDRDVGSRRR